MSYGDLIIKLPRKNVVSIIEAEQATLTNQIDKARADLKQKTRELLELQPSLTDMDPYVVKLLVQQREINQKPKGDSSEDEELEV